MRSTAHPGQLPGLLHIQQMAAEAAPDALAELEAEELEAAL